MDIKVIFSTVEHRDAFANRWNLDVPVEGEHLDVPWHLLQHAKSDMNSVELTQLDDSAVEHEFIVNGDSSEIEKLSSIVTDLGSNWYVVKSTKGVELSKVVDSIEINSTPVKFLENVSTINSVNGDSTTLDPASAEGQWARIRVASQFRPLASSFALHNVAHASTPELYIIDSGINFDHAEFDYPELEKVNFFTLENFNDNYSDDIGHGTAVLSMAVGKNLGIARKAKVMNVKIGGMVDGVQYTASLLQIGQAIDAIMTEVSANPNKSRVVNVSWGTPRSAWLDAKFQGLVDAGVTVVCAAGNSGISVEDVTPAGLDDVITVGAIDKYDVPAGFNNISPSDSGLTTSTGLSLDLFAPGDNVMVADCSGASKYMISSGTSFAAPLVSGVALEIAGLNSTPVLENTMKSIIMNSATEDALLFEDERFSDNQNRLVYLITRDPLASYKTADTVSYLGVHNNNESIVADLNSSLDITAIKTALPDDLITYSVVMAEDSVEYAPFVSCDPDTGIVTISKPDLPLPEETKLKMVNFKGVAENSTVKAETNTIFFFAANPLYQETLDSDITLALTEVNSVSFFAFWTLFLK